MYLLVCFVLGGVAAAGYAILRSSPPVPEPAKIDPKQCHVIGVSSTPTKPIGWIEWKQKGGSDYATVGSHQFRATRFGGHGRQYDDKFHCALTQSEFSVRHYLKTDGTLLPANEFSHGLIDQMAFDNLVEITAAVEKFLARKTP